MGSPSSAPASSRSSSLPTVNRRRERERGAGAGAGEEEEGTEEDDDLGTGRTSPMGLARKRIEIPGRILLASPSLPPSLPHGNCEKQKNARSSADFLPWPHDPLPLIPPDLRKHGAASLLPPSTTPPPLPLERTNEIPPPPARGKWVLW